MSIAFRDLPAPLGFALLGSVGSEAGVVAVPTLAEVLAAGNDADALAIANLADPMNDQDAATKKYVDDLPPATLDGVLGESSGEDIADALLNASSPDEENVFVTSDDIDGIVKNPVISPLVTSPGPVVGAASLSVSGIWEAPSGIAGEAGQPIILRGGSGNAGANPSAELQVQPGTASAPGRIYALANGVSAASGEALVGDGNSELVFGGVIVAAGVPAGAPDGKLPFAYDTTAVTGGLYFWNGAAWVKVAEIL